MKLVQVLRSNPKSEPVPSQQFSIFDRESLGFALDDVPQLALGTSAEEFADAEAELHCVEAWIYTGEACVGNVQVA